MDLSYSSLCGRTISELDRSHTRHLLQSKDLSYSSLCALSTPSQSGKFKTFSSTALPLSQVDSNSVPPEQRRHPRRSQGNVLQKPPTLVRQEERKATFVDGLVGMCLLFCFDV
jgi:hypothetical protein